MLRRNLPCRFDTKKRHAEDYLLWLQVVLGGWPAWFIESTLAYSYKEDFGQAGLSKNLWQMERGVLDALKRIRREKLISRAACLFAMLFSILKFIRRLIWVHAYYSWKK
jgi:teichuronic acid biosynthesis glycosyltransferase TuaG